MPMCKSLSNNQSQLEEDLFLGEADLLHHHRSLEAEEATILSDKPINRRKEALEG